MKNLGFLSCVSLVHAKEELESFSLLSKWLEKEYPGQFEIILCYLNKEIDSKDFREFLIQNNNFAMYSIQARDVDSIISAGIEMALGDWIIHLTLPYIDDAKKLLQAMGNYENSEIAFLQILPKNRSWSDKIMSLVASKVLESEVQTLLPTPRLIARSALYSWNLRRGREKVFRIAPHLDLATGALIDSISNVEFDQRRFLRISLRTIVHASSKPLRWLSFASWAGALASLIMSLTVFIVSLKVQVVAGWTTTNLQISLMSFLILSVLGFLTEYIYQISMSTVSQPSFRIKQEELSRSFDFKKSRNLKTYISDKS